MPQKSNPVPEYPDERMLPSIGIVTPSYNQARYIRQTIDSVLHQDYPNLDYVIVDGGSTDGTQEILRSYGSRIRWISEKDRGQSDAINKGLGMVQGDILAYLNSDDVLLHGSLRAVGEFFASHHKAPWVSGYCRNINEKNEVVQSFASSYKHFLLRHYRFWTLVIINYIGQMSTFWTRGAFKAVGFFSLDHHLVMDYDYWIRLAKLGAPGILRQELSAFRLHKDTKSTNRYIEQFQQSAAVGMRATKNPLLCVLAWLHNRLVILAYRIFSLR